MLLPETDDPGDFIPHVGVVQVQVGHVVAELALVVPVRAGNLMLAFAPGEIVPADGRAVNPVPQGLAGLQEPGVQLAGVVDHQIQHHADAPLPAGGGQRVEVRHGAIRRVDGAVVHHVVLVIADGGMDGHQPDAAHAQRFDVVQTVDDALQVAPAVAVAVLEGRDKDFIRHAGGRLRRGFLPQGAAGEHRQREQQSAQ